MRRSEAFDRLAGVRDELAVVGSAVAEAIRLLEARHPALSDAIVKGAGLETLRASARHLEMTYVLRLFSEFEGVPVDYWRDGMRRGTRPAVSVLIDRIAANRLVSPEHRAGADAVRECRNDIIHQQEQGAALPFDECKAHLGRFLSWMPEQW